MVRASGAVLYTISLSASRVGAFCNASLYIPAAHWVTEAVCSGRPDFWSQ